MTKIKERHRSEQWRSVLALLLLTVAALLASAAAIAIITLAAYAIGGVHANDQDSLLLQRSERSIQQPLLKLEETEDTPQHGRRLSYLQDTQQHQQHSAVAGSVFMSDYCAAMMDDHQLLAAPQPVSVIITARDEPKEVLLKTVRSVLMNGSPHEGQVAAAAASVNLVDIVIVDDCSADVISEWPEWNDIRKLIADFHHSISDSNSNSGSIELTFVQLSMHRGSAFAKNKGAAVVWERHQQLANSERKQQQQQQQQQQHKLGLLSSGSSSSSETASEALLDALAVVFLDAHVLVSPLWLVPLSHSLQQHPNAMVYPTLDILVHDTAADAEKAFQFGIIRSDDSNAVMGFDWALKPRWEHITSSSSSSSNGGSSRVKTGIAISDIDMSSSSSSEALSPSAPGIFAVHLRRWQQLQQQRIDDNAADEVELSIRNWLCGGLVIRQSCSRVAHRVKNLHSAAAAAAGATQFSADLSTMKTAEKWLDVPVPAPHLLQQQQQQQQQQLRYADVVYQARFLNRIPYAVDATPSQSTLSLSPMGRDNSHLPHCLSFQWYLDEVYPGLLDEVKSVQLQFSSYLASGYLDKQPVMQQLLAQYRKSTDISSSSSSSSSEIDQLRARQLRLEKNAAAVVLAGLTPPEAQQGLAVKHVFKEPAVKKSGLSHSELLLQRADQVRSELLCEDFNDPVKEKNCAYKQLAAAANKGPKDWCLVEKPALLFQCPKTCGFCDITDGKFCEDFYLTKCPQWASQGKCGQIDQLYGVFNDVCRKSCHQCTPLYSQWTDANNNPSNSISNNSNSNSNNSNGGGAVVSSPLQHDAANQMPKPITNAIAAAVAVPVPIKVPLPVVPAAVVPVVPAAAAAGVLPVKDDVQPLTVDPTYLHREYLAGRVPDSVDKTVACAVRSKPEGQMMSKFKIADLIAAGLQSHDTGSGNSNSNSGGMYVDSDGQPLRIFCGIYTMESAHAANVAATRNSWAKRCDGFIAFSTAADAAIPALRIEHDGAEEYDNMWQKSRAIWQFIHRHLRSDFDFFLLGGDDMFYIVENLRYYLGSAEITRARQQRNGLFIGRLFQPPNQIKFNSGGAGYILDRKALDVLGRDLTKERCRPHQRGFWEDVNVANCLKVSEEHIVPYATRDPMERERFHPFTPGMQLTYRIPPTPDWYAKYNPDLRIGYDCCAEYSISFHYAPANKLNTLYNFMYNCKDKSS